MLCHMLCYIVLRNLLYCYIQTFLKNALWFNLLVSTELRDLSNLKIIKARQKPHHDIIQTKSFSKIIADEIY